MEGKEGNLGKPGRTGEYGKNGWDVGYTDFQTWSSKNKYGENQDLRLCLDRSTSSSGRVYCGYKYDVLGSPACYATIKSSKLEHRKLTESEKCRDTRKQQIKRRKEAMASRKSAIQRSVIEQSYSAYFEKGDNLFNKVSEMHWSVKATFDEMRKKAKNAFEEVERSRSVHVRK